MRNTTYAEESERILAEIPDDAVFQSITLRENLVPEAIAVAPETIALDSFVSTVKWAFLFLPGAGVLHFTMMALSLFFLYGPATVEIILGTIGVSVVGMFMVMFGLGQLTELKYLRVVAGIIATAALASIAYSISIVFIPGDFFGWFTLLTLPLTIIIGQLIKFKTDRDSQSS
jgi:hypothetical protein